MITSPEGPEHRGVELVVADGCHRRYAGTGSIHASEGGIASLMAGKVRHHCSLHGDRSCQQSMLVYFPSNGAEMLEGTGGLRRSSGHKKAFHTLDQALLLSKHCYSLLAQTSFAQAKQHHTQPPRCSQLSRSPPRQLPSPPSAEAKPTLNFPSPWSSPTFPLLAAVTQLKARPSSSSWATIILAL